ncbi:hypothetical protein NBRC10512_002802 [Rhodotorula toruloides]
MPAESKKRPEPPSEAAQRPPKRSRVDPLPGNPLFFYREPKDTIQISTWNVAGLESCNAEKWNFGFRLYVEAEDPHILAITEVNEKDAEAVFESHPNFEFLRARYPYRYWSHRVAVVSKLEPLAPPVYGFPEGKKYDPEDARARAITLEFKECDFNVIRTITPDTTESNDLQWGAQVFGKYSGTSQFERDAHERLLGDQPWLENPRRPGPKFVDVWRLIKGEKWRQYTHSSKKVGGWRLDGFIVSERFLHNVRKCEIRQEVKRQFWPPKDSVGKGALSDHWPVWLSLEMEEL